MDWKTIAESDDLIVFEKDLNGYKLKIEARRSPQGWEVFKTKVDGSSSMLISEHLLDDKSQALDLIGKLKTQESEKTEIKMSTVNLKRTYKEDFVEKWLFFINRENIKNFLVAKYDSRIRVDIVMHEKYYFAQNEILAQISEKLGFSELGEGVNYEIYFFRKHTQQSENSLGEDYVHNFMDIEFDMDDENMY